MSPRGVRSRSRGKEPSRRFLVDWMQRKAQREQTHREQDRAGLGVYTCTWAGCGYTAPRQQILGTTSSTRGQAVQVHLARLQLCRGEEVVHDSIARKHQAFISRRVQHTRY